MKSYTEFNYNGSNLTVPQHLAIIMDGNGRWAKKNNLDRTQGHIKGIDVLRDTIIDCIHLGVEALTVFAFSTENWKRPEKEVEFLIKLLSYYLRSERFELKKNGVKLKIVGRLNELPDYIVEEINKTTDFTKDNNILTLNIAVNYGGRAEIIDAVNKIISSNIDKIDETKFKDFLYLSDVPYPDLIIRTGGEVRISNFLLWEMAYSELYFTDVLWPEFTKEDLYKALYNYSLRERRYGGV